MSTEARRFVIAGAGISGLTLALALAKFGATVTVLERADKIDAFGAGLQIGPNARRVLDRLGVGRYLTPVAFVPQALDVVPFRRKAPLIGLEFGSGIEKHFGHPYAVAHRADLASAIHSACKRFANIDILFGVKSFDIEHHARGLSVLFDEADGRARSANPFAFIGADGVHSRTRTEYLDGPEARYTGYTAWRALLDADALTSLTSPDNATLLAAPGAHAVLYPLPHRKKVNLALFTKVPHKKIDAAKHPLKFAKVLKESQHFRALMERVGDNWTKWPLHTVSTKKWSDRQVGLVGDAAHAMLPFQAQGAAMGIEDAAVLAPLLMTEPDAASAFQRFQAIRQQRVARVAKVSASNGRIFHLEWPWKLARDITISLQGPQAHWHRLQWLYGYDPSPEIETAPGAAGQKSANADS